MIVTWAGGWGPGRGPRVSDSVGLGGAQEGGEADAAGLGTTL